MDLKLRRRLIGSIDFLRRMDFFKDYSNLASGEILDKILNGEMDYTINWEDRPGIRPRGAYLALGRKENREWWMKRKIAEIDCELAPFDMKRFFIQEPEVVVEKGIGVGSIKRLARISIGVFQPVDISEYMHEYEKEIPPELRQLHYAESNFWQAS